MTHTEVLSSERRRHDAEWAALRATVDAALAVLPMAEHAAFLAGFRRGLAHAAAIFEHKFDAEVQHDEYN